MAGVQADERSQNIARGVVLIVATGFVISCHDVIFKLFGGSLSLWQVFSVRAALAFPLFFALAWWQGRHSTILGVALQKWLLVRAMLLTLSFMAFYAAIPFLSLSTVGAGIYIAPIFVTLLSAYVIAEPVGARGWIAVLVGFAGVFILLQPGTDAFSPWALVPLVGAFFYALAHITTRAKCQTVPLIAMALSVNIVMLVAGLIMSVVVMLWQPDAELVRAYPNIVGNWSPISPFEWLVLGVLAILIVLIGIMVAGAYQSAPPSIIATFEYSYLVFVAMWDIVVFGISPSSTTILGMVLIVGAGLLALRRR